MTVERSKRRGFLTLTFVVKSIIFYCKKIIIIIIIVIIFNMVLRNMSAAEMHVIHPVS